MSTSWKSPKLLDFSDIEKVEAPLRPSPQAIDKSPLCRLSLDNNPFDTLLKQTRLFDGDPFESVSQKVELQKRRTPSPIVITENLLGLNESVTGIPAIKVSDINSADSNRRTTGRSVALSSTSSIGSWPSPTVYEDSPFTTSANLSEPQSESSKSSLMNRAFVEDSKTETNRQEPGDETVSKEPKFSSEPVDDIADSKAQPSVKIAPNSIRKQLLKFGGSMSFLEDSSDDLNSTKPIWIDSETEQDSDIEGMRIPMLRKIDKEAEEAEIKSTEAREEEVKQTENLIESKPTSISVNLETIRERVNRCKVEKNNLKGITEIVESLKEIVLKCSEEEQSEAGKMLENLHTLIDKPNSNETNKLDVPLPIIRQGTFDLDKSAGSDVKESLPTTPIETTPEKVLPDIQNLAEQIGKLIGNQSNKVFLHTNPDVSPADTGVSAASATYIVVMNTPLHSKSYLTSPRPQTVVNSTTSPNFEPKNRRRSQSLTLSDNSLKKLPQPSSLKTKNSAGTSNTPMRPYMPARRISIGDYRETFGKKRTSLLEPPLESITTRRSATPVKFPASSTTTGTKKLDHLKLPSAMRNLKLKSTELVARKTEPVKATVPIKRVAPMMATATAAAASSSSSGNRKGNLFTSTPNPPILSSKGSQLPTVTSMQHLSPKERARDNSRHRAHSSVTPNPKSSKNRSVSLTRRRSLTEAKSESQFLQVPGAAGRYSVVNSTSGSNVRRSSSLKLGGSSKQVRVEKNKENNRPH